ncbi:MAG: N-acetylneuraminate synthase family protein [Anaerolineaceae bacterium]|nr:N-acetylneuraminate synthase family protein [Anaerolineaceae bacterium]
MKEMRIGNQLVGVQHPTYFIADIGANHDGSLDRTKELIKLAKDAGADAAKFQNFQAAEIVSDYGFRTMGGKQSHQSKWEKSVFEVYQGASVPFEWTPELKATCDEAGIDYFSSPYDFEAVDMLDPYVPAYKIGSGDITWLEVIERMARKEKPVLLATGAANIGDVQRAVHHFQKFSQKLVLMQCNTNYTADPKNYDHIHLNVLKTYQTLFPDIILGLSDHTFGHATVLGAVALGARVVEKHFTDDNDRIGPDHPFAMNPDTWADMVENTRLLERALGSTDKFVTESEEETVVVQQRCLRAGRDVQAGEIFSRDMLDVLRPAVPGGIKPYEIANVIGTKAISDISSGKEIRWTMLGE